MARRLATLLLIALLALAPASLRAQGGALAAESAVARVGARLDSGVARRDRAALEPLIADPFTWVHASDGRVDAREGWLANAAQGMALSGQRSVRTAHGVTTAVHGAPEAHTVVRTARVRLRDTVHARESWIRQTQVFVRGTDGGWRLALGQGTLLYEGVPQDPAVLARYAGRYRVAPGRVLTLSWEDDALFATLPNGAKGQIFLASPTEEAVRTVGGGQLRFTLGPDGRPTAVRLVRGEQEAWRATRESP